MICHECGNEIPQGTQCKETVKLGVSSGRSGVWGPGVGWMIGWSSDAVYGDVWKCPACYRDSLQTKRLVLGLRVAVWAFFIVVVAASFLVARFTPHQ